MGSAVSEVLAQHNPVPLEFIGVKNTFGESGQPNELMEKYGMKSQHIVEACKKVIARKNNNK